MAEEEAAARIGLTRARVPVRRAWVVPLVVAVVSLIFLLWSFTLSGPKNVGVFLLAYIGGITSAAVACFVAARWATRPPRVRRHVVLDRADIVGVEVVPTPPRLVFWDRRLDVYEQALDAGDSAAAALARLGLTERHAITRFNAQPLATSGEIVFGLGAVVLVLSLVTAFKGPVIVVLVPLLILIALCATPSEVVVGSDGVHVRWLARRVFAAVMSIEGANVSALGAVLYYVGGRTSFLAMPHRDAVRFIACVGRVRAAVDASVRAAIEPQLARGGRGIGEWLVELRKLLRAPTYRDAALPSLVLWSVVEDASRAAVDRAAAAIALSGTDANARVRIGEIAHLTALPDLRAALEAIAENTEVEAPLSRLAR